jgi:hypothetical protein
MYSLQKLAWPLAPTQPRGLWTLTEAALLAYRFVRRLLSTVDFGAKISISTGGKQRYLAITVHRCNEIHAVSRFRRVFLSQYCSHHTIILNLRTCSDFVLLSGTAGR